MRNPFRSKTHHAALDRSAVSMATKRLDTLTGQEATTATRQQKLQQAWQEEAFTYADLLGEVKYAYRYTGKAMGKLRPYPAVLDPTDLDKLPVAISEYRVNADPDAGVDGDPLPQDLIDAAQVEVARVRDSQGNAGPILRRLGENLFIVGEAYLVGTPPDVTKGQTEEQWAAHSIAEIVPSRTAGEGRYELKTDPSSPGTALPPDAKIIRIWSPHPKWGDLADSSMRGALDTCDELLTLSRSIRGAAMSRLAGAGIAAIAQELSFGNAMPGTAASGAAEDGGDPLTRNIMETMMAPISDPASAAAAVPLLMRVPADMIKDKSWIDHRLFERGMDPEIAAQRNELRTVLATDLDIPPEILTGKADSNHWTAWQIDEDTFKGHVEPDAQLVFDAWTTSLLRPALLSQFPQYADLINLIVVWYDATALVIRPNRSEDADKAFDRYAISWEAYRSAKGFTGDDAPSEEEIDARVKIAAASKGKPEETVPVPEASDSQSPPAQSSSNRALELQLTAATAGRGGLTHLGSRLQRIDADLRSKLLAAADSAMRRTMEKAGVKVKSKVNGRGTNGNRYGAYAAVISGTSPDRICALLGRATIHQLGFSDDDLIGDEAFAAVGDQFDSWVADAQERTRSLLADVGVSAAALTTVKQKHETDRAAARDSFVDNLKSTAQDRLYGSTPADDSKGEFTGVLVAMSVIRTAMAIAGGAHSSEGSSGLTPQGLPVLPGEAPALGVANGPSSMDALSGADITTDRYEWVYGISTRPFEPHLSLDGVEFEAWDDDVLVNSEGWPDVPYFMPGDHSGCACDAVPTYVSTAEARPAFNPTGEPLDEAQAASAGRAR